MEENEERFLIPKDGCIYKATNIFNGKVYIGQTIQELEKRKRQHIKDSINPKYHFHRAIKKYGEESFLWEVLHYSTDSRELNNLEIEEIKKHSSYGRESGYNMTIGGDSCVSYSRKKCLKWIKDAIARVGTIIGTWEGIDARGDIYAKRCEDQIGIGKEKIKKALGILYREEAIYRKRYDFIFHSSNDRYAHHPLSNEIEVIYGKTI
jgi:hypothetical protein